MPAGIIGFAPVNVDIHYCINNALALLLWELFPEFESHTEQLSSNEEKRTRGEGQLAM